jgi:hypothetical protein
LIPKVDTEQLSPIEFLQFFRDTLGANIKEFQDRNIGFFYTRANPITWRFAIPSSEQSPMMLMQYNQSGHQNPFGDKATHEVLIEPDEPGDFKPFLQIDHPINLRTLTVGPADGEGLTFYSRGGTCGEFGEGSVSNRQNLGRVATDFVELVS